MQATITNRRQLGTFNGVVLNSVNTIFGAMVFLRWPFATGEAGVLGTYIILFLGLFNAIVTSTSMFAIVTTYDADQMVNGGVYFYVSRALGPALGGTFGLTTFVNSAVAIGFVSLGFAEAFAPTVGTGHEKLTGCIVVLVALLVTLAGIEKFTKMSMIVLAMLIFGLLSGMISVFFVNPKLPDDCKANADYGFEGNEGYLGFSIDTLKDNLYPEYKTCDDCPSDVDFLWVCSLVFPSMMGIFGGVNISGDLKDAVASIPLGSFISLGVLAFIYGGVVFTMGSSVDRDCLRRDYNIIQNIAYSEWVVFVALLSGTFSTALSMLLGASRILEKISDDNLFPYLTVLLNYKIEDDAGEETSLLGSSSTNNNKQSAVAANCTIRGCFKFINYISPETRTMIVTFGIAVFSVVVGSINVIAPSMLHSQLFSFALINYACFKYTWLYERKNSQKNHSNSINSSSGNISYWGNSTTDLLVDNNIPESGIDPISSTSKTSSSSSGRFIWKPKYKYYHWFTSLIGIVFCCAFSLTVDYVVSLITFGALLIIYLYIVYIIKPRSDYFDYLLLSY